MATSCSLQACCDKVIYKNYSDLDAYPYWTFDGRKVSGPDLLARTIFYKVDHPAAIMRRLRDKGLEQLAIAAIPVDHEMAVKKRWGKMPLPELVEALRREAKCVLRSDEAPTQPPEDVAVKELYFDISL
jgi:hypothetical protein